MRRYVYLLVLFSTLVPFATTHAQSTSHYKENIPTRYFSKVSSKTQKINKRLSKRTQKALQRLQKQEERIQSKFSKIDTLSAEGLQLRRSIDSLSHLQDLVQGKVSSVASHLPGRKYIPYLDSLQSALGFLKQSTSKLNSTKIRGSVTGTKVRVLDSSPVKWLTTTTYYDDKGRILQTLTDNITGGEDVITNKYDFSGKVAQQLRGKSE